METIEPFRTFEDEFKHSVPLRDGIDIQQLTREASGAGGGGVEFEIDYDSLKEMPSYRESLVNQEEVLKNLSLECTDFKDDSDSDDDMTPFERMALQMEKLTADGGVLKKVLRPGAGVCVPEGAVVRAHYNGYLEYCDEPYDSSRLRNSQLQFTLGNGEVIPAWEIAIASMRKTELSRYLVKPEYAYGAVGCPPRIPPSASIVFEIEVLSFVDSSAVNQYQSYSKEEKDRISIDQLLQVANTEREFGNDLFEQRAFGKASSKYGKAVRLLENARLKNDEEEEKWKSVLVKLLLNQSLCSLRMRKGRLAISQCRRVLELEAKNVKAHFRIGQAHMQLSDFDRSKNYLVKAGKLCPGNSEIRQELVKLDKAVRQFQSMEKSMMKKMFEFKPAAEVRASGSDDPATHQQQQQQQQQESKRAKKSSTDLTKTREVLVEKLSVLAQTYSMRELVLPASLEPEEVALTQEVAAELELLTEMRSNGCLRIFKPGYNPEDLPPDFK